MELGENSIILFQGDSITDGNRMKDNPFDLNHQIGHSYAYIIASKIGAEQYKKNYKFINRGISGNRISDLYARIEEDIINLKPDLVSVLVGVNDAFFNVNENSGASPEKYELIYRLIIEEIKEKLPDCKIILCEPFILPVGQVKEKYDKWNFYITSYQNTVKKLAKEYELQLVLLQESFNKLSENINPNYWIWDGIHPTEAGHYIVAEQWLKVYEKLR